MRLLLAGGLALLTGCAGPEMAEEAACVPHPERAEIAGGDQLYVYDGCGNDRYIPDTSETRAAYGIPPTPFGGETG